MILNGIIFEPESFIPVVMPNEMSHKKSQQNQARLIQKN